VITRRNILLAGSISLLVAHRLSHGQPAPRIHRVGVLLFSAETRNAPLRAALKQGMHDLGWLEGKNVEYLSVSADGDVNRVDALANELVAQQVDVIVVGAWQTAHAAQRATKTIPVVMAGGVADPVSNGFAASLARPGGNITGTASQFEQVFGKLIQILHEVTPSARRFAILLNESNPSHSAYWTAAQSACAALNLVALRIVASTPTQFGAAVEQIVQQRSEAVVVAQDPTYWNERARLQDLMQTTRLPVAYGLRDHVVAGGLLSYAPDLAASWRYAGQYVDKILKGAKPGDLPIDQPAKLELVINLTTAKALGLTIPSAVLLRANEVIE
jgi:putative ABC transport system substrate-binding protein